MNIFLSKMFIFVIGYVNIVNSASLISSDPRHGTVRNSNIPLVDDCALRAFTVEMAAYIQPNASRSNWTALSESALQMNECHDQSYRVQKSSNTRKSFETLQTTKNSDCFRTIFVQDSMGNDLFDGTLDRPLKTIPVALSLTRNLRLAHGNEIQLCIVIRGGTYYLGTNATTNSSQIGAISLTSNDSNLIIENYKDERVILSGGILLQLQWSVYKKTSTGGTIMKALLPPNVKLSDFNELYIDGRRAIVAKYPNGDPATQGLYAKEPGFSFDAEFWWQPEHNRSQEIHIAEPFRNGTHFSHYQIGLNGGASVFNPPSSFWSTARPYGNNNYVVPRGVIGKLHSLPHMSNWTKPTTGLVHVFHSLYWGSWVFEIASVHPMEKRIMFGRGGFQEARGHRFGGPFYVANIFEELDSPNEWFLDKDSRTLYFMPNGTMPNVFVASQISCLISLRGNSIQEPVNNISIRGLIFTETSNTYLRDYIVPSGGDWSVHRGGTIFLTNTTNVTVSENLFTELGSNAVAVIEYNKDTLVTLNEFVWLADSAVILVGTTNGIDGFSVATQPTNIMIL
ncbi:unnamed protein product [Adineta ricciae]|uniref:Uncharacterized protein n=1 Tax=Adineta ricciae TaxID=249248 RepID=A0A814KNA5_ADIRI|nr:unnamed protein product [Adineta ricciae]CAF1418825.1 unnamed protein product [Adineta ricciae]